MKTNNKFNKESRSAWFLFNQSIKVGLMLTLVMVGLQIPAAAQDAQYTYPSFRFGVAAGANFNYYRGTTQQLNSRLISPTAFRHGEGVGLFLAPMLEYHNINSIFGAGLQVGFDSRKGTWDQVMSPCDCPLDLSTNLSYLTIEPTLRIAPGRSPFYLFVGPRIAVNTNKRFTFEQGINQNYPDQVAPRDVNSNFSEMENIQLSMQVGAGYDIPLSSQNNAAQFILSPFASFHPYFGQSPRKIENWNLTTIRVGAALKLGVGSKIPKPRTDNAVTPPAINPVDVRFSVNSPANVPTNRVVREIFPLRNYIFFTQGSTAIPSRYVRIDKDEVADFKENQLAETSPDATSSRSQRALYIYHNILNILGDRMNKNPSANINLVGSSEDGVVNGKLMAESVKTYLVDVFSIAPSRITTEGRDKPRISSEQPGGKLELDLLREDDQRVSIESSTPAMLVQFQPGTSGPLNSIEFMTNDVAPVDSYVTFNNTGSNKALDSWKMEIRDDKGSLQSFGPYYSETVTIPGKTILGNVKEGNYKVTMIGQAKDGSVIRKETNTRLVLWEPSTTSEALRYSILFEFNDSKAIDRYKKYLEDIVAPSISQGATVIISGYTDKIGEPVNNQELSMARATEARNILSAAVNRLGRSNVKFEVKGFGENESLSPFANALPEERFYNRTVLIDILPANN
jgi:outer membrane protein OmpA-like peptidoglycan-associated protein